MGTHVRANALSSARMISDGKALSSERLGAEGKALASEGVAAGRVVMKMEAQETPEAAKRWAEELDNALDHQAVLDAAELARIASTGALPVIQHPVVMAPNVPPPIIG